MKTIPIDKDLSRKMLGACERTAVFQGLTGDQLLQLISAAELIQFEVGEGLTYQGDPSDSFLVILKGEASVRVGAVKSVEVGRVKVSDTVGEMGLLLEQPRKG